MINLQVLVKKNTQIFKQELKNLIQPAKIDPEGKFKYILLRSKFLNLQDPSKQQTNEDYMYFVRGFKKCVFHKNIFEEFHSELQDSLQSIEQYNKYEIEDINPIYDPFHYQNVLEKYKNQEKKPCIFDIECIGGGRILHDSGKKEVLVYGYSTRYGQPEHQIAVDIIQQFYKYPQEQCSYSNEGY